MDIFRELDVYKRQLMGRDVKKTQMKAYILSSFLTSIGGICYCLNTMAGTTTDVYKRQLLYFATQHLELTSRVLVLTKKLPVSQALIPQRSSLCAMQSAVFVQAVSYTHLYQAGVSGVSVLWRGADQMW